MAGFGALCLTVDTHHYSRRERDISKRYSAASARTDEHAVHQSSLDWAQFDKLRERYKQPLVVKGIATAEDAKLAVEHGVDVTYVCRTTAAASSTRAPAPSTCCRRSRPRARPRPDHRRRRACRGTDVIKAIALGADMVCAAGSMRDGMAAAGRDGIYRVLELLQDEIDPPHGACRRQPPQRARSILCARRTAGAPAACAERVPAYRRAGRQVLNAVVISEHGAAARSDISRLLRSDRVSHFPPANLLRHRIRPNPPPSNTLLP